MSVLGLDLNVAIGKFGDLPLGAIFFFKGAGATQLGIKVAFDANGNIPGLVCFTKADNERNSIVPAIHDAESMSTLNTMAVPGAIIRPSISIASVHEGRPAEIPGALVVCGDEKILRCWDRSHSTRDVSLKTFLVSNLPDNSPDFWFSESFIVILTEGSEDQELAKIKALTEHG